MFAYAVVVVPLPLVKGHVFQVARSHKRSISICSRLGLHFPPLASQCLRHAVDECTAAFKCPTSTTSRRLAIEPGGSCWCRITTAQGRWSTVEARNRGQRDCAQNSCRSM